MTNDEDTHASIVAAAVAVIAETGYASASLTTVAERADVPEATVVGLFGNKPTLIAMTMGWMYGDLAHYVGARLEGEPEGLPKIQAYIRAMNRYFFDNPGHIRVMGEVIGSGELVGPPGDQPATRRWQSVADMLAEGQRNGVLGKFDPRAVAIVIGGAIDGLLVEWTTDSSFDLIAATEELARMVSVLTRDAAFTQG
ncbi:TetR/AcrR family transcriptional regulator [Rhodococcoides yunnanense]|uniref:TetR/AcrR family transcriptional regulator n=1 Tax=Rhodococcoides yunnanense TaxID=278209 RepID=UPI000934B3D9|nr:TetR/AcrR family transcriptional regulator [Rhodococcus yunnanensis]